MHLIARPSAPVAAKVTDAEVSRASATAGVIVRPLSAYYADAPADQGLLLGFAGFDEAELTAGVEALVAVLRGYCG